VTHHRPQKERKGRAGQGNEDMQSTAGEATTRQGSRERGWYHSWEMGMGMRINARSFVFLAMKFCCICLKKKKKNQCTGRTGS